MLAAGLAGGCVILAAIAGGYLVGESAAVTESQAASAYEQAAERARTAAEKRAFASSEERGQEKGLAEGRGAGEVAGTSAGRGAGQTSADEELAAIEAEEAAEAAAAEAAAPDLTYVPELPHGEPGYVLPLEERTLSCVGYDADTGQCIGD